MLVNQVSSDLNNPEMYKIHCARSFYQVLVLVLEYFCPVLEPSLVSDAVAKACKVRDRWFEPHFGICAQR